MSGIGIRDQGSGIRQCRRCPHRPNPPGHVRAPHLSDGEGRCTKVSSPFRNSQSAIRNPQSAFTLIEVLVVAAVIALLMAILLPSLSNARQSTRAAVCASNIRQLVIANHGYAAENRDYLVPGGSDEYVGFGGRRRWHGTRKSATAPPGPSNLFDPRGSPLIRYLRDGVVKECPSFRDYTRSASLNTFEAGSGGYGYNRVYLGGRIDLYGSTAKGMQLGAKLGEVHQPSLTVMFTDVALAQLTPGGVVMAEESYCYPPFPFISPGQLSTDPASPSIHFRHNHRALSAWADGHADARRMSFSGPSAYLLTEEEMRNLDLGWFGQRSNDLFDLK